MFGMDGDNRQSLYDRARYVLRSEVDAYQTTILTPLPGTTLYAQLKQDGRLLKTDYPADWNFYQFFRVIFKPKSMHPVELFESIVDIWSNLYSKSTIRKKALKTFWQQRNWNLYRWFTRGWQATLWAYYTNWNYRNMTLESRKRHKSKL